MNPKKTRTDPGWKKAVFLTTALTLLAFAGLLSAGGSSPETDPLPFDPLSQAEQEQAITATLEDMQVKRTLSEHHEVIGAALNTDKHRLREDPTSRMADVWVYDYTLDHVIHTQVDLRALEVSTLTITNDYQPPITAGEKVRAGELALADADVQAELDTMGPYDELETMARLWTGTAPTSCPTHRCALVTFLLDGDYQGDVFVRVNLSLNTVEEILAGTPNPHARHQGVTA